MPVDDPGPSNWRRTLVDRLRTAMLKPAVNEAASEADAGNGAPERSFEDVKAEARASNDKERLIGLAIAPLAAVIALITSATLVSRDPAAGHKGYVPVSTYDELLVVMLAMSVVMLATAFFRKRLYFGMFAALYGLAQFNLHYYGFGVPFILVGSWFLVRAYRLNRDLKEMSEDPASGRPGGDGPARRRGRANKRYTPPT